MSLLEYHGQFGRLEMQKIEKNRREWSRFCVPISDCGKSFGAVLIFYAIFQVLAYAAVSLQQNRKSPNLTVFLLYLSILSYCIVVILSVIMGIVIFHTETGNSVATNLHHSRKKLRIFSGQLVSL